MSQLVHILVLSLALSLLAGPAMGSGGFAEVRLAAAPGLDGDPFQLVERLRPRFRLELDERLTLYSEVELLLTQGQNQASALEDFLVQAGLVNPAASSDDECCPYQNETIRINEASDYLEVARLYLDIYLPAADIRIGRQSIYWGSAALLNPTDPFPELLVTEPWRPRRGTNAIRASIPMGNATDLTLVLGSDDAFTTLRTAGRLRTTWAEADLALVGAYRGDDASTLVGLDIRGTLGVGYWLEVAASSHAWRQPDLAVGIDYSFPVLENLQLLAQYYRNGRGRTTPNPLRQLSATLTPASDTEAPSPFAPILGGLDYVMVSAQQIIAPEITLSAALMTHLGDGSAVAIPTMTYTPLDWLQCSVSGQLPLSIWGSGGEFNPAASSLILTQGNRDYDLSGLVPDATITFWTRASY